MRDRCRSQATFGTVLVLFVLFWWFWYCFQYKWSWSIFSYFGHHTSSLGGQPRPLLVLYFGHCTSWILASYPKLRYPGTLTTGSTEQNLPVRSKNWMRILNFTSSNGSTIHPKIATRFRLILKRYIESWIQIYKIQVFYKILPVDTVPMHKGTAPMSPNKLAEQYGKGIFIRYTVCTYS